MSFIFKSVKNTNKPKNFIGKLRSFYHFSASRELGTLIGYLKHQKKLVRMMFTDDVLVDLNNLKDDEDDSCLITETTFFSTFFIFKLVKNIEDESTKKKFLNHATILDLVDRNWHAMPGFIYCMRLFMFFTFLVFYSINLEIYSKSDIHNSQLNLASKIICLIFSFIFLFLEVVQFIFHTFSKDAFGYIFNFKNFAEILNYPLCITSLFYDMFGSNIEVKSSLYSTTILISYYIFIKSLDKISVYYLGAYINVIGIIIRKSFPITLLLLIAAIGFILPFRNRSTYYEMSGIGGDDLTQMSNFNTSFEFNIFQILEFVLGGIASSQMGIDVIQSRNWVNFIIYGCFIFIMAIMFFNILTAVSLDGVVVKWITRLNFMWVA